MVHIHIRQGGFLGNHMYQYMLAKTLAHDIQKPVFISGYDMEAWGLHEPAQEIPSEKVYEIRSNLFNYAKLVEQTNKGVIDHIVIRSLAMRMEYYREPAFYRNLFVADPAQTTDVPVMGDDRLLVHIRGGDILEGVHPDHHPLPFRYYHHLIETSGLEPAFMGQIGDDEHSRAFKREFSRYEILPQRTVLEDFETIRRAKNVAISVSSFSWMATWLSASVTRIYCPIAGFLHPDQRIDIDILPTDDPRYVFYQFPTWLFKADGNDYDKIYGDQMPFHEVSHSVKKPKWEANLKWFIRSKRNGLKRRLEKIGL